MNFLIYKTPIFGDPYLKRVTIANDKLNKFHNNNNNKQTYYKNVMGNVIKNGVISKYARSIGINTLNPPQNDMMSLLIIGPDNKITEIKNLPSSLEYFKYDNKDKLVNNYSKRIIKEWFRRRRKIRQMRITYRLYNGYLFCKDICKLVSTYC